jgi:hypothetical protein
MILIPNKAWTRSVVEELLSGIWLIAGLLAWQNGLKVLAWLLFLRCIHDTLCAICVGFRETLKAYKLEKEKQHVKEG